VRSIGELSLGDATRIEFVLCDIDDTLTRNNLLEPEAFEAIWRLKRHGITVVPVTGRPAGWCDMIIRQWPVGAVVGENGAFAFYLAEGVRCELVHPGVRGDPEARDTLAKAADEVYRRVPGTRPAMDQFCRRYDVAVDFREQPPYLGFETAEEIRRIFEERGVTAKISSIHVNAWLGAYDKREMSQLVLERLFGVEAEEAPERVLFCGDSPNDEPMFRAFRYSCGVANIREFAGSLEYPPCFVTDAGHGRGFAELADVLLGARPGATGDARDPG